jgi:hypothetical protein
MGKGGSDHDPPFHHRLKHFIDNIDDILFPCYDHDRRKISQMEVCSMKFIIKLFLFPITLALTILVAACRLLCQLSTMLLGILAFVVFAIALGTMVLLQDFPEGLRILGLAWLISPLGLPLIAAFLVELLGIFNDSLKAN